MNSRLSFQLSVLLSVYPVSYIAIYLFSYIAK